MNKTRRHSATVAAALLLAFLLAGVESANAQQSESQALARTWVQRLSATMEEHASQRDVDHLLELYADDAIYEHPHAKARVEGKDSLRKGISAHLGETRNPKLQVIQVVAGNGFAVIEFKASMDIFDDNRWAPAQRRQVVVLEFDGERINRITDHWDR